MLSVIRSPGSVHRSIVVAGTLMLLIAPAPVYAATLQLQLDKSVILMRHGLRSPNQTPAELAKSSTRPWPEWPVGAGELTEHGADLIKTLGGYYRQRYATAGLLPADGCPDAGSVAAWSDNAAARIPLSGQALLDGMFPGCGLKVGYAPQTNVDPLFNPVGAGTCAINQGQARGAVLDAARGDLDRAAAKVRPAMKQLQSILKVRGVAGCAGTVPSCGLDGLANMLEDGKEGPKLEGGLKRATTVGENFLLEYAQGFPESDVAWGDATTAAAIAPLLAPRNLYLKLTQKTPYLASRNGAPLARAILAALEDDTATDATPSATRLVAFVGRDGHLANLSALLGVDWSLPGQPDNSPLGGTLAFERLHNPVDDKRYVRVVLYYQTLEQMRSGAALDAAHPPGQMVLKIPGCEKGAVNGACPLPVLRERLLAALAPDCPRAAQ